MTALTSASHLDQAARRRAGPSSTPSSPECSNAASTSRHLEGVHALHPHWQHWAEEVRQVLGDAHRAVAEAIAASALSRAGPVNLPPPQPARSRSHLPPHHLGIILA